MDNKTKQKLGKIVTVFRSPGLGWRGLFAHIVLGVLVVLIPLAYGFYRYYYGYTQHGSVAANTWSRPWYLLSLLGLLLFGYLVIKRFSKSRRYIALYKNGVSIHTNQSRQISWDQIQGLSFTTVQPKFLGITLTPYTQVKLYLQDSATIQIDEPIDKISSLLALISKNLYPRLEPRLQEQFTTGEWVEFGPIMIHRNRLRIDDHELAWQEVHRISVISGRLVVESANQPAAKIPILEIPNFELMLQIVQAGVKE